MNRLQIDDVFKTDENGRFICLVIPPMGDQPQTDLSGKARLELTLEEIVLVKKYAAELYSHMEE